MPRKASALYGLLPRKWPRLVQLAGDRCLGVLGDSQHDGTMRPGGGRLRYVHLERHTVEHGPVDEE
eukprot:5653978-Pyramimonas_sp.AAC.1